MQNQNKSHSTLVDECKNRGAQARYIKRSGKKYETELW